MVSLGTINNKALGMKIFNETLCRFIEARAKTITAHETCEINGSGLTTEELSACLNSTQNKLRLSKLRIQRARERFPYEVLSTFIFLIVLMVLSFLALFYQVWWVGLVGMLSVFYLIISRNHSTGFKNDWIYTFILKLRLKLWKIPPHDDEKINPRCIFVPWNKHQTGTWGEWLYAIILPKLQSELGITDMKGLDSIIKNAEYSSNEYQSCFLWRDGVMIPRNNVLLWLFLFSGILSLVLFTIGAIYYESNIAKFVLLSGVGAVLKIVYGLVQSNKENVEPDVEANVNICDVICRLHRVMKKETIFFAVVASKYDDLNEIPLKYQRYFKFLIISDKVTIPGGGKYNYSFNIDWLQINEPTDSNKDSFADIAFNCIILKRFITESEDNENLLRFLRLLHKINNDNNNVLTNSSMLYIVRGNTSIEYLKNNSDTLEFTLRFTKFRNYCFASVSNLHLQAMGLFTTQIQELKNQAEACRNTQNPVILPSRHIILFDNQDLASRNLIKV